MSGEETSDCINPPIADLGTPELEFKRLTANCGRGAFSCGKLEIDKWFRNDSLKDHVDLTMRTVVARGIGSDEIIGFYAIRLQSELLSKLEGNQKRKIFSPGGYIPVVRACWLGVRSTQQKRGIGTAIMGSALRDFYDIAVKTGVLFMTLTAIDEKTSDFYRKLGFLPYGASSSTPSMLISALDVIAQTEKNA